MCKYFQAGLSQWFRSNALCVRHIWHLHCEISLFTVRKTPWTALCIVWRFGQTTNYVLRFSLKKYTIIFDIRRSHGITMEEFLTNQRKLRWTYHIHFAYSTKYKIETKILRSPTIPKQLDSWKPCNVVNCCKLYLLHVMMFGKSTMESIGN